MSMKDVRQRYSQKQGYKAWAAAQTKAELVAGVTGKVPVLDSVLVTGAAALTIIFYTGTTQITHQINCPANAGFGFHDWHVVGVAGSNICATTDLAGQHGITFHYHYE